MKTIGAANTYNSDQSGFNLELHSGRTLTTKGSKKVTAIAQSINATTHCYAIQPVVNAEGKFISPMLSVFQEPSGGFGPIVKKKLFKLSVHNTLTWIEMACKDTAPLKDTCALFRD